MKRAPAFAIFALAATVIIPAAFGLASLVAGYGDRCLLAIAEDRAGTFCQFGIRLRFHP